MSVVTLSLEIELAWGMHANKDYSKLSKNREPETASLKSLLAACDEFNIPFTFDVVGHLLHDSCDGTHNGPHPEGWFTEDPGTNISDHPLFYAPDLVELIYKSSPNHEIATHSYSHILFDEVSIDTVHWEMNQASKIHSEFGLEPPSSLVPPDHREIPMEILNNIGINQIRVPFDDYERPNLSGKIESLVWLIRRSHPVENISTTNGVIQTPCTPHPSLSTPLLPIGQSEVNPVLKYLLPVRGGVQIRMNSEAVCFLSDPCPKTHASAVVSPRLT